MSAPLRELAAKIVAHVRDIDLHGQSEGLSAEDIVEMALQDHAYAALLSARGAEPQEEQAMNLQLHRCKVCGTRWLLWPDMLRGESGWSLLDQYQRPGECCGNAAMGDQIEYLRDLPPSLPMDCEYFPFENSMKNRKRTLGSLSVAETQSLLGSDRPVSIGKVPTDPIGMRTIAAVVSERLVATPPAAPASAPEQEPPCACAFPDVVGFRYEPETFRCLKCGHHPPNPINPATVQQIARNPQTREQQIEAAARKGEAASRAVDEWCRENTEPVVAIALQGDGYHHGLYKSRCCSTLKLNPYVFDSCPSCGKNLGWERSPQQLEGLATPPASQGAEPNVCGRGHLMRQPKCPACHDNRILAEIHTDTFTPAERSAQDQEQP